MTTENLAERVEALEDRVAELEQRLEKQQNGQNAAESDLYDRYDRYVINNAETDTRPSTGKMRRLYQEAGLVDRKKIKRRMKRLDNLGAWE
jgi:polyhydroxyalkanoate synthesis regulator phasin